MLTRLKTLQKSFQPSTKHMRLLEMSKNVEFMMLQVCQVMSNRMPISKVKVKGSIHLDLHFQLLEESLVAKIRKKREVLKRFLKNLSNSLP